MDSSEGEGLISVPDRLRFDAEDLRRYLQDKLPGFVCQRGGLAVRQFRLAGVRTDLSVQARPWAWLD